MKRIFTQIGRRGAFLTFLALLDLLFGYALLHPHVLMFDSYLPARVWAALWGVTGLVCLIQAFMKWDRIAFTLAIGMKIAWGMLMFRWWIYNGLPLGWISVVIWWGFAATVGVVAGWAEPTNFVTPDPPDFSSLPDSPTEDSV